MSDAKTKTSFIVGNILLALCLGMLFFINDIWAALGSAAMLLWAGLAAAGMYLVMSDKRDSTLPD